MISEKTLRKWRKEALKTNKASTIQLYEGTAEGLARKFTECQQRILKLTQELLDQHLLKK